MTECKHSQRKHYAHGLCKVCYTKWLSTAKKEEKQLKNKTNSCGHPAREHWARSMCEQCYKKFMTGPGGPGRERHIARSRQYDAIVRSTPEGRARQRSHTLKYRYGITSEDFNTIYKAQSEVCDICHKTAKMFTDHCHTTGRVRGLLCNSCNKMLGNAHDDPGVLQNAAKYLQFQLPELS